MSDSSHPAALRIRESEAFVRIPFKPVPVKARHDGWTPERQQQFIEALAASACVEEAARTVGLSASSAYRLRAKFDAQSFRLAWDAALDYGIRRLSDAAIARAIHGEAIPHYYKGELVGEHRRYDNRLAQFLLRYRDPLRYAATMDEMVYTGHQEGTAIRLARLHARVGAGAEGFDLDALVDHPWGHSPIPPAAEQRAMARKAQARKDEADRAAGRVELDRRLATIRRRLAVGDALKAAGLPDDWAWGAGDDAGEADDPGWDGNWDAASPGDVA